MKVIAIILCIMVFKVLSSNLAIPIESKLSTKDLEGVWTLKLRGNQHKKLARPPDHLQFIKIFKDKIVMILHVNESNVTGFWCGAYLVQDGVLMESITHALDNSLNMIPKSYTFKLTLQDNTFIQKGIPEQPLGWLEEHWVRRKSNIPKTATLYDGVWIRTTAKSPNNHAYHLNSKDDLHMKLFWDGVFLVALSEGRQFKHVYGGTFEIGDDILRETIKYAHGLGNLVHRTKQYTLKKKNDQLVLTRFENQKSQTEDEYWVQFEHQKQIIEFI